MNQYVQDRIAEAESLPDLTKGPAPCGIVIGHFGMPGTIRFQHALNQTHLKVPMLVTDDWTWESRRPDEPEDAGLRRYHELIEVCRERGLPLKLASDKHRCKHAGGDLGAFYHGLQWAQRHGIEYLMKLSMRAFIYGMDGYLQETAAGMKERQYATASHVCQYGNGMTAFQIRSEIVIMHVPSWCQPQIMAELTPRPNVGVAGEIVIANAHKRHVRTTVYAPAWFGASRTTKYPGLWWHDNHSSGDPVQDVEIAKAGEAEARAIAKAYGVDLGEEFHARVSSFTRGYVGF